MYTRMFDLRERIAHHEKYCGAPIISETAESVTSVYSYPLVT